MYNIYSIVNTQTGDEYVSFTTELLNKVWRDTLQKYTNENSSLYNAMRYYGINRFKIRPIEEYYGKDIDNRVNMIMSRRKCTYNKDVIEYKKREVKRGKSRLRWGIQRKKKPKAKKKTTTLKCRCVETGKLKTLHGWEAAARFCNGDVANIKRAIKREGVAYGYKWWIYKKAEDAKRKVYGIHKEGHITPVFDSISDAMRAMDEDDRGKGICTSIKWGQRWRGYLWYYADAQ